MVFPATEKCLKIKIKEEKYGRPVETIMKCDDFKSNFARRLSNRYVIKSDSINKMESGIFSKLSLKRSELEATKESAEHNNLNTPCGADKIDLQVPVCTTECPDELTKPHLLNSASRPKQENILSMEVAALNSEVETLRWQLKQTEANRQMHIALLEQVVSFLSRVKEHMESQKTDELDTSAPTKILPSSFTSADLPRSRSVFHVNKSNEHSLTPTRKLNSRKISKSISNVNGYHRTELVTQNRQENRVKDFTWKQEKMSLIEETNINRKIIEESSRIITLAKTVLTTKIPNLSCSPAQCIQESHECRTESETAEPDNTKARQSNKLTHDKLTEKEVKPKNSSFKDVFVLNTSSDSSFKDVFVLNTSSDSSGGGFEGITNKYIEARDKSLEKYVISASSLTCGLEDDFAPINLDTKCERFSSNVAAPGDSSKVACTASKRADEKKSDSAPVFVEDESGFSSMSSFQEIGIPIINVIPPTPLKERPFLSEDENLAHEEAWKPIDLDKQAMKVFWV